MHKPRNHKKIFALFLTVILGLSLFLGTVEAFAEPQTAAVPAKVHEKKDSASKFDGVLVSRGSQEMEVRKTMEKVSGEITSIGPSSLGIFYEATEDAEYEMLIPLSKGVKVSGYTKISDVKLHDIVDVEYEKIVENPDTDNMRITKSVKSVKLVKRAPNAEGSGQKAVGA